MTYVDDVAARIQEAIDPEHRPAEHADALYRLYALLVLVKGTSVTDENVHDAWSTWKIAIDPENPDIQAFTELSLSARRRDEPFTAAIRAVARTMGRVS